MRSSLALSALCALLLAGCATFKELQPKPELSPAERGYIEFKNDAENFRLEPGKRYFVKFPRPGANNFALVLQTRAKRDVASYLTKTFDDGKEPIALMADEYASHDSMSVYAIDSTVALYYWVIDTVRQEVDLSMKYRYVPRWRFTFETRYKQFRETLADNIVDRGTYESRAGAPPMEGVDFAKEIGSVGTREKAVASMLDELRGVAWLFPADIAKSRDTSFVNYKNLRAEVEEEVQFQQNYLAALGIFQRERNTWGNSGAFLSEAGSFAEFLGQKDRYPAPILSKARKLFQARLNEATPFYEKQLQRKKDVRPFNADPPMEPVEKLYRACGTSIPAEFDALRGYIKRFNAEAEGLRAAAARLKEVNAQMEKTTSPPPQQFYATIAAAGKEIRAGLPQPMAVTDERYRSLEIGAQLALELGKAGEQADDLAGLFGRAEQISADIAVSAWGPAEQKTRDLAEGSEGKAFATATRHRDRIVSWFESGIFNGVKAASIQRIDAFVKINEATILDVPKLYADSAFQPVYVLTFSSLGSADLAQKKAQIDDYIAKLRHYAFPEAAIKTIYKDFPRDMNAAGVDRARAIVEHGKMYKGTDKQIAGIVSECDPMAPKSLVRAKEYRRVLAFPVTNNRRGTNEYVFRLRLQIPSDAQFPVFDINLKLPKDLAESAGREAWYDLITINKNPIKNEGRFRITAPTADNNFESQITPVQMDKEGNNILEVRFKKAAYKVFEISAMAQVPLMKKN
jgi:hypothetical protein